MKYKILRVLDVSGFTFLRPVVLLCHGEEPREQLRQIGRLIVVPALVIALAVIAWNWAAPKHKTKSGEVPTPLVVWDATKGIWNFHSRESDKSEAYELTGTDREAKLAAVQARLAELKPMAQRAAAQVEAAEAAQQQELEQAVAPLERLYQFKSQVAQQEAAHRERVLRRVAEKLPADDLHLRGEYLIKVREHLDRTDAAQGELREIKAEQMDLRRNVSRGLREAQAARTAIAEEQQYLWTLAGQLGEGSRELKLAQADRNLKTTMKQYLRAEGQDAYALAAGISTAQQRIEKASDSAYAKPWSLPDQIIRSLACVFFGFFLGSAIAIPIGILCGLSKTFMAAVTPFIALLKPVSPIVWLPIALIIVGGFITDPDKHWLMQMLQELPLVGWLEINPAFIASGVTVALCSLWPTLVNTALGVASIDKDHLNVARVLRLGFAKRLTKIVIPSSLPLIFAGLRISLSVGWMVLIAAELLSSSEGIGKFVWDQFNNGASDSFAKMFVVVFVVGALGFLLDRMMIVFQRLVSFDGAAAAL
jgi:nitrate/nitrite transport system permease protein